MEFTKVAAKEFFWALRNASIELLDELSIPVGPAYKTGSWRSGRPVGMTIHYTAGVSWKGSATWLNSPKNRHSSCHFLVLDRKLAEFDGIYAQYAVLDDLPVTIVMLADLKASTWHATWSNSMNVGIENRNAGQLAFRDGKFFWWANNWQAEYDPKRIGKTPVCINGRWWEPYTRGQVAANVIIGRMLHKLHQNSGGLDPNWIIPHSAVQRTKYDTGLAYPIKHVRDSVFTEVPVDDLSFLSEVSQEARYLSDVETEDLVDWSTLGDRSDQDDALTDRDLMVCSAVTDQHLSAITNKDDVLSALSLLGYNTGGSLSQAKIAVVQFQRCMGLTPDGIPGRDTIRALTRRLEDFGFVTPASLVA